MTMGDEGKTPCWTWGDWFLLALPLVSLPVVADRVGDLAPSERSDAWLGFAVAAVAGIAIGSIFVRKLGRDGIPEDAATRNRNRRRNSIIAFVFGGIAIALSRVLSESVQVIGMGAAFGLVVVVMVGYGIHVSRRRDASNPGDIR
jgi:hypothetical protein